MKTKLVLSSYLAACWLIVCLPFLVNGMQDKSVGASNLSNAATEQVSTSSRPTLSSPAESQPVLPDWATHLPLKEGSQFILVTSEGNLNPAAAEMDLRTRMEKVMASEIDRWIKPGAGKLLGFDWKFIDSHLRDRGKTEFVPQEFEYGATIGDEFKYTYTGYTLLELDESFRREVFERWEKHQTYSRLLQTCLIGGVILIGLISVFSFFRLDNATRGFYTRRLLVLTILFLIVAAFTAHWFGCSFPWL